MTSGSIGPTFSRKGLSCRVEYKADVCEAEKGGIHYGVLGDDETCIKVQGGGKRCGGHVLYVQLSAGFTKANASTFKRIWGFFNDGVRTAAGKETHQVKLWIRDHLAGDRHVADFGGFNFEIDPGTGYPGDHPNVTALTITGINLTLI